MRSGSVMVVGVLIIFLLTSAGSASVSAMSANGVTGSLTIDGKRIDLAYVYVDEVDPAEPIIVLSDKPLPPEAVPFIPEKMVKEKKIHAIAFSVSQKGKNLTNTYGILSNPGNAPSVGLGRVEEGKVKLTITRLDEEVIEGKIATTRPVTLSFISYEFDLSFKAELGKKSLK